MTEITNPAGRQISMACVILAVSFFCEPAQADNWPSFRGPLGSGVGEGAPPATWNVETGENVLWKVPVEGLALASPIVWGDRLFLATAVGKDFNPKFQPDPSFGYDIQREKDVWRVCDGFVTTGGFKRLDQFGTGGNC